MRIPFVDLKKQYESIRREVDEAIASVIADAAFIGGKENRFVRLFEEQFAEYLGVKNCVGCGNGTDAIEILLKGMGIGHEDEVIVPANSWISTAEAVGSVGATPVFVDVHPTLYTIDTIKIEPMITARTKAIIPVHLYGLPADMDPIVALANRYNLRVLEDCAQAHGAKYKGAMVGTIGHAASFSFYPGKNLGAYGDAGCMVTHDDELAQTLRRIANHGQLTKHDHTMEGRNSRLDGIQAAVLSVKLPHLKKWTELRIEHAAYYSFLLQSLGIQSPTAPPNVTHVFHLYVVLAPQREAIRQRFQEAGIGSAVHYPTPLPLLPPYAQRQGNQPAKFPIAVGQMSKILSLPMYPELRKADIEVVVQEIRAVLTSSRIAGQKEYPATGGSIRESV
jgi:dTDP-4-amino-4,6-dideoxygalactose transaminase